MSLATARLVSSIPVSMAALCRADAARWTAPGIYTETARRAAFRALLDAAAVTGSVVRLAFIKVDGSLRYMQAVPCQDVDGTCSYYTVQDVDLSEAKGRTVYRRVSLDTIARLDVEFQA